ncbi:MAG: hypothetical protein IBJ03_03875 [Gemmatimonadaceae bacterium]|nr:hypothetical protein [Gemmatimonadaceae bacterium]
MTSRFRYLKAYDRWPLGWILSAVAAMMALAWWQQAPSWPRLLVTFLATGAAAWLLPTIRRAGAFGTAMVVSLSAGLLLAGTETATLTSLRRNWTAWSATEREARAQRVAASLTEVAEALRNTAASRAADSQFVARASRGEPLVVAPPLQRSVESALLVYRRDTLVARAGQVHTRISPLGAPGVRLEEGAFHTSLVARARSADGRVEVVAAALVSSAPPADRFARALLQSLPGNIDVAHTRIESPDSAVVDPGATVVVVPDGPNRLARVRATTYTEGETRLALEQRARTRTSVALAFAVACFLIVAWRKPARTIERALGAAGVLGVVALAPLTGLSNVSTVFDPSSYFAPMGGPLTSTIAALLITAVLLLAVLLFALRTVQQKQSRLLATSVVLVLAAGGPFLLRDLARGISLPATGAGFELWIAWQLALALIGAAVLLAGAAAGQTALGTSRGLPAIVAPLVAAVAALLAGPLWDAPGAWPPWYPALWVVAIGSLALTRKGLAQVVAAAVVAGAGATTLTWGATARARMALVEYDLQRNAVVDDNALRLLERFASELRDETRPAPRSDVMLRRYASSELARAGYPARLARWSPSNLDSAVSVLELAPVVDTIGAQAYLALLARNSGQVELRSVDDGVTTLLLAAVPAPDGIVTTIAVPPRTRLLPADPFAAFTGVTGARGNAAPYRLTMAATEPEDTTRAALAWRRRGDALFGDGVLRERDVGQRVQVEVDIGGLDRLVPRGSLLIMLDVLVVLGLWSATALADGALGRLVRVRRARWSRSYRVRLSGALLAFFTLPAVMFGVWAWYRLQDDDRAARELLVRETLRVASAEQEQRLLGTTPSSTGAPLFFYRHGMLTIASDPLLDALAPLGRLLPGTLAADELGGDAVFTTQRVPIADATTLVGFRHLEQVAGNLDLDGVLATPARGDEFALDARREDLGILLLFATMIGALAAVWSSGVAARSLARPVGALREAALAIAAGREAPSLGNAPATEFAPVYRAFGRMSADLATSRAALEAAQRRTAAVLQNVASGVVAFHYTGDILLANPRAGALLGRSVQLPGASLASLAPTLAPLVDRCRRFFVGTADDEAFDIHVQGRQLQARLTRLPSGAVLTIDDITALASAQRVLAWGEMARQVAHEIKNPLTPIRLGVQHLRRAWRDGRGDFSQILDTNVSRVLEEIDHLDEIARAFSRYGTAPSEREPAVTIDVARVVRDVIALERLGDSDDQSMPVQWEFEHVTTGEADAEAEVWALGQRDELREVMLNLLENARLAAARTVRVRLQVDGAQIQLAVVDDGSGIAPDVLPHVFEPHFSTRTSGSGLGLAISRRLIEGWGGTISVTSSPGEGTTVHIRLVSADRNADMDAGMDTFQERDEVRPLHQAGPASGD